MILSRTSCQKSLPKLSKKMNNLESKTPNKNKVNRITKKRGKKIAQKNSRFPNKKAMNFILFGPTELHCRNMEV